MSITKNGNSLIAVCVLALVLIYNFVMFAFAFFRGQFGGNGAEDSCRSLSDCLTTGS